MARARRRMGRRNETPPRPAVLSPASRGRPGGGTAPPRGARLGQWESGGGGTSRRLRQWAADARHTRKRPPCAGGVGRVRGAGRERPGRGCGGRASGRAGRAGPSRAGPAMAAEGKVTGQSQEQFLLLAKAARGAALASLIHQVLEAPGIYVFGELLDMPAVREVGAARPAAPPGPARPCPRPGGAA